MPGKISKKPTAGVRQDFDAAYFTQLYNLPVTFHELSRRLLAAVNRKVRGGEISQRRLARLTGFTQPHIHNVLHGSRSLRPELADAILGSLELSMADLLGDCAASSACQSVGLWRGSLGPHRSFPDRIDYPAPVALPAFFLARFTQPTLLRLAADEETMTPLIEPGDVVLVDRAEDSRGRPVFGSIYALALSGQSAVCRCQRVGGALVLVAENGRRLPALPDCVPLARRDILDVVRGRVVWAGREFPADSL